MTLVSEAGLGGELCHANRLRWQDREEGHAGLGTRIRHFFASVSYTLRTPRTLVKRLFTATTLRAMARSTHKGEGTRDLLQALLDHFWEARRKKLPREPRLYPSGYLISYTLLIQRAGILVEARRLGGPLAEISALCELKGWPPLAALVVRQDSGQPGVGYFRRPGSPKIDLVSDEHLRGWEQDARACIAWDTPPRRAPSITERQRAAPRPTSRPTMDS